MIAFAKPNEISDFFYPQKSLVRQIMSASRYCIDSVSLKAVTKVPTRPGDPGKMRVYLENMAKSKHFEIFNKNMDKYYETWKNWQGTKSY